MTAPLPRIIDTKTFLNQASRPLRLNGWIWDRLLLGKTQNQQLVLKTQEIFSAHNARACTDLERMEKHKSRLKSFAPEAGNIRLLFLTDRQWSQGATICGPDFKQGNRQLDLFSPRAGRILDVGKIGDHTGVPCGSGTVWPLIS